MRKLISYSSALCSKSAQGDKTLIILKITFPVSKRLDDVRFKFVIVPPSSSLEINNLKKEKHISKGLGDE